MPGTISRYIGNGRVFSLRINKKTVDSYVQSESFNSIKIQCESKSIWDFVTDSFDITLDISVLSFLSLSKKNYHLMRKLSAELFYYNKLIFGGIVGGIEHDEDEEELNIEFYSYGRVIKDIVIEYNSSFLVMYGYTPQNIITNIVDFANRYLKKTENNYPFSIDHISVDIIDFPFYKSLESFFAKEFYDFIGTSYFNWRNLFIGIYYRSGVYYYAFHQPDPYSPNEPSGNYLLYPFNKITLEFERLYVTHIYSSLKGFHSGNIEPVFDKYNNPDEDNLPSGVVDIIRADSGNVISVCPDGQGGYYAAILHGYRSDDVIITIKHYRLSDEDVYWAKYKTGVRIGEMLKDLAIMTNSIVWVGPNATIYLQHREGREDLAAVNAINFSSEITTRDPDFKLPEAYLVKEDVKNDIINFLNDYISGDFYLSKALVFKDEISSTDPIMLKNLPVKPGLQKGTIESVNYNEDVLEIETWQRIADSG